MFCSACGRTFEGAVCPVCKKSDLDDFGQSVKWDELIDFGSDSFGADAKILGDSYEDWSDASVVPVATASPGGRVSSFLFYVPHHPGRMVRSASVPSLIDKDTNRALTPFEDALVQQIDGVKSVRELAEATGLPPRDVVSTLLSLIDSKIVALETETRSMQPRKKAPPLRKVPIQERVRATKPPPVPASDTRTKAAGISRVTQAQTLFDQAMKDRTFGNFASAKMSLKLALTYDPDNVDLQEALKNMLRDEELSAKSISIDPKATALYHEATIEETRNNVDKAIELLEKAIAMSEQALFYNRLGVILATRKKEIARGRQLILKAMELDPTNKTYRHNLSKLPSEDRR